MAARARKEYPTMAQMKITGAAVSLAIALAASAPANAGGLNRGVNSVNQPVVQRVDYAIDIGASGNGVADSELYRLSDWFESLQLGYGDRVFVDADRYGGDRARQDVARVAAEYGLLVSHGAPITSGSGQSGSVRVIVSRSEASVPGCPDWADGYEINARISTASNYGCAVNSNFARMIADPNDLVLGQTHSGNGNAATASKAIKLYRDTAPTGAQGLKETVTKGGK
jgi:pilus assembly protein CpaD